MLRIACSIIAIGVLVACNSSDKSSSNQQKQSMETLANKDWIKSTNVYEVNLRQYSQEGTINAFLKELPRLKDMGVETLWFMPITPIAKKNMKGEMGSYYAAADYTSISPEFGTMDDFKNLVKEAHKQGFKVIIDWVANHTGWDHVWTKTHPEYFEKDSATGDFKIASGMDDIIELDFKNPELRRAMIDAMKFWIQEADIDGFRCDLAFWVELDFWVEAKKELDSIKKLFWLGELDPLENPEYMEVFDAAYTWAWMHKAREFYHNHLPISELDSVLHQYQAAPGYKAWFTTNHDENSWNGTEYEKYGEAAKALAVFSCTWPGMPLIYSGQELPNQKRLEFFKKDPIEWNGKYELHEFYKKLLSLHSSHPALSADEKEAPVERLQTPANDKVFAFKRKNGDKEVVVVLNLSREQVEFTLGQSVEGTYNNLFSDTAPQVSATANIALKPWEYLVLYR